MKKKPKDSQVVKENKNDQVSSDQKQNNSVDMTKDSDQTSTTASSNMGNSGKVTAKVEEVNPVGVTPTPNESSEDTTVVVESSKNLKAEADPKTHTNSTTPVSDKTESVMGNIIKVKPIQPAVAPLPFKDSDAEKITPYDLDAKINQDYRDVVIKTVNNTGEKTESTKRNELLVKDLYGIPHQVQEEIKVDLFQADIPADPVEVIPQDTWLCYSDQERMINKENVDNFESLNKNPYAIKHDDGSTAILPDPTEVKIPVNIKTDPGFYNVHPALSDNVTSASGEVFNMDGAIASNYAAVSQKVMEKLLDPSTSEEEIKKLKKDASTTQSSETLFDFVTVGLPAQYGPAAFIQVLNSDSMDYQEKKKYITKAAKVFRNLTKNSFKVALQPIQANSLYQSTDSRHLATAPFSDQSLKFKSGKVVEAGSLEMISSNEPISAIETSGIVYSVQQSEELGGKDKKGRTLVFDTNTADSDRVWKDEIKVDRKLFFDEWDFIKRVSAWNMNFTQLKKQTRYGDGTGMDSLTAQALRFATNDRITDNSLLLMNTMSSVFSLYNSLIVRPKVNKFNKNYHILYNPTTLTKVKKVLQQWQKDGNFLVWKDSVEKTRQLFDIHKLRATTIFDKRNPLISKVIGFMSNYDIQDPKHQYSQLVIPSPTAQRDSISLATIDFGMISSNMLNNKQLHTFDTINSTALSINTGHRRNKVYDFMTTVYSADPISYKDLYLSNVAGTDSMTKADPFKTLKAEITGLTSNRLEEKATNGDDSDNVKIRLLHESNNLTDFGLQYLLQISALQPFFERVAFTRQRYGNVVDKYGLPLALSSFPELILNPNDILQEVVDKIEWILNRYNTDNIQPNGDYIFEDLKGLLESKAQAFGHSTTAVALNNLWSTTPYLGQILKPSQVSEALTNLKQLGLKIKTDHTATALLNSTLSRSHLQVDWDSFNSGALSFAGKAKSLMMSSAELIDLVYSGRTHQYTIKPLTDGAIITRRLRMTSLTDIPDDQYYIRDGRLFSTTDGLGLLLSNQYMQYIMIKPTTAMLPFFPEFYLMNSHKDGYIPLSVYAEGVSTFNQMTKNNRLLSVFTVRPDVDESIESAIVAKPMMIQPVNFTFVPRNHAFIGDAIMDEFHNYTVYRSNEPSSYLPPETVRKHIMDKEVNYIKTLHPFSLMQEVFNIKIDNVYTQTDDSYRVLPKLLALVARIRNYMDGIIIKFTTNAPQPLQLDVYEEFVVDKHIATYKVKDILKQKATSESDTPGQSIISMEAELPAESLLTNK